MEGHTTQCQKKKYKQQSQKTEDRVTRTPI
jgi:hypothetical protein